MRGVRSGERNSRMILRGFGSRWVKEIGGSTNGVTTDSFGAAFGGCMNVSGIQITNAMAAACVTNDSTADRPMRLFRPGSVQSVNR